MARFRDGNFKVRKGGWAKNNWFEVAQREGYKKNGCKKFSFTLNGDERAASKTFDTGTLAGKHAYLWRFYNALQDEMKQEGVGLTDRPGFRRKLTITYPDRNIRRWWSENIQNESSNSWFLFNVHLAEGDWNRQETMIHEWMHRWDVEHTRGWIVDYLLDIEVVALKTVGRFQVLGLVGVEDVNASAVGRSANLISHEDPAVALVVEAQVAGLRSSTLHLRRLHASHAADGEVRFGSGGDPRRGTTDSAGKVGNSTLKVVGHLEVGRLGLGGFPR
jgi:hypothetical protein